MTPGQRRNSPQQNASNKASNKLPPEGSPNRQSEIHQLRTELTQLQSEYEKLQREYSDFKNNVGLYLRKEASEFEAAANNLLLDDGKRKVSTFGKRRLSITVLMSILYVVGLTIAFIVLVVAFSTR
jgi:hypothetical protein